jgi:nucleotide-binding universal stress UspA family protein
VLVDVGGTASLIKPLIHLGGRIAHGDDGVTIPFAVAHRTEKAAARHALAEAETAAEAAGYDCTGVLRLSDSYGDGTLELADETDATLVVLGWSGPRLGVDQIFGTELDRISATSPVPTAAAHLTGPWERVIVVPGAKYSAWQSEEVRLALDFAARLTAHGSAQLPLLVIADDEDAVRSHLGTRPHEFVLADRPGDVMVSLLKPTDLVVAPSYLLPAMPLPRRLRLSSALAEQNLVIVAAPGRSTSMGARPAHTMDGLLGQHS